MFEEIASHKVQNEKAGISHIKTGSNQDILAKISKVENSASLFKSGSSEKDKVTEQTD